ncbi:hypothetical protein E4T43_08965 [Aureobasidium subglaciale]|nr:hypothetical protein E4T43_08965 [Aureobasidium subglaciale]
MSEQVGVQDDSTDEDSIRHGSTRHDPIRDDSSCNDSIRDSVGEGLRSVPCSIRRQLEQHRLSSFTIEGYSKSVVHSMINHIYGFQELDIPITAEANGEESDVLLKKLDFCFQMYPIGGEYQIKTFQVAVAESLQETRSEYKPLYREMSKYGPHVKRNDFGYLTSEDLSDNGLSASESEDEFEELTSIFDEGPIYTGGFGAHGLQHWSDDELSV